MIITVITPIADSRSFEVSKMPRLGEQMLIGDREHEVVRIVHRRAPYLPIVMLDEGVIVGPRHPLYEVLR